jgi:hypothetical protein
MKHYDYEISRFVEDELPEAEKIKLTEHLTVCEKCRETLKDYKEMRDNIKQFYIDIPGEFEIVRNNTDNRDIINLKSVWTRRLFIPFAAAASLIIGLMIFQLTSNNRDATVSKGIKPIVSDIQKDYTPQTDNKNIVKDNHGISRYQVRIVNRFRGKTSPTDYVYSVAVFNDVIDKAITVREDSLKHIQYLMSIGMDSGRPDDNSTIDSTLMKLKIESLN